MFDLLDALTSVCGGEVKAAAPPAVAVPKNEAEDSPSPEHGKNNAAAEAATLQPVDPMDAKNYLVTNLTRPMGILFEENHDARHGGAFVAEIHDGCSAKADGSICRGDQLIAIGDKRVSGMDFGEVIKVIEGSEMKVKLTFFRGPAESLYCPSGASIEWLDEFVAERGEEAALVEEESESEVMPAIIADVAVIPDLLDDVAVATAAVPKNEAEDSPSPEHGKNNAAAEAATLQPVDPMDAKNYLVTNLTRPMGILFEENHDARHGGAFVAEIHDGCSAKADGSICRGDQLIAIGDKRVSGMDFGEVIKLIFDNAETKVKLTFFRGPAESLYGPSGASIEWLDEFVAERGEEAALVEEESESEVTPAIIADVAVIPDLLDDVAVAKTAVEDACALGDSVIADQRCVDAESCDDKHVDAALVVEDEVDMNEVVECEAEVENEVDTADEAVFIKNDANPEAQVVGEAEIENEVGTTEDVLEVEEEADVDEGVAGEAAQQSDASMLKWAVKEASEDWLDSFYANAASQSVSNALAAVSDKGINTKANSTLDEQYIPHWEEPENLGSNPVDTKESFSDVRTIADAANGAVQVEYDSDDDAVPGESASEKVAPMLDASVTNASRVWLGNYFANPESQLVSDDELDVSDTLDEPTEDLNSCVLKAVEGGTCTQ